MDNLGVHDGRMDKEYVYNIILFSTMKKFK